MSSLVVNTNLSAIETLNDLNATNNAETSAISRLSSGLQIANAATGPAQYVVSQSLESEANGYGTAIDNAQDGVSMIQTVSGALSQISSILQTMEQLALTSANGATETSTALTANQSEFSDLENSINEIARTTTFGTTKLLVGTVTTGHETGTVTTAYSGSLQVGAFNSGNEKITLAISAVTTTSLHLNTPAKAASLTATNAVTHGTITVSGAAKKIKFEVSTNGGTSTTNYTVTLAVGKHTLRVVAGQIEDESGTKLVATVATDKLTVTTKTTGATMRLELATTYALLGFAAGHVTASGEAATALSIATSSKSLTAVTAVQNALKVVDGVASTVGATQNELNAIVSNLTVGQQNLQAADSQLVDVNMAQEMTTFSTDQILMQSGVSMLAQAQQLPSLVLKLMGG